MAGASCTKIILFASLLSRNNLARSLKGICFQYHFQFGIILSSGRHDQNNTYT